MLLGLTATPKTEVDRNTYRLFDLEDNVPTYFYELDRAVSEEYLVPPRAIEVPLKFIREGIKYNELSEADKEEYEATFFDDETGTMPEYIEANHINDWLFNADTIDKVLAHVMENGLKIEGGDRLGKTIIFAKNHLHALEIKKRFDILFPAFKGNFAQVIDYSTEHSQTRIDDFTVPSSNPVIAISVDMLDTGIDVHEIVNLVFFKAVKSRAKFWQMIGRGTRTCPDLFGPGNDKLYFLIFDFCDNFAFFEVNPQGISPHRTESLTEKIFKKRVFLAHLLRNPEPGEEPGTRRLFTHLADTLHRDISELDPNSFIVRSHRKYVVEYSSRPRWDQLELTDVSDIESQLAHLLSPGDPDEFARRFDLLIISLQLSIVEKSGTKTTYMKKLRQLAASLEKLKNIPAVKTHIERIHAIQTEQFRHSPGLWELEEVRQELRDLIKFIESDKQNPVYTDLEDVFGEAREIKGLVKTNADMQDYRLKMEKYIRDNQDHLIIYKLKQNLPITQLELEELERLLFSDSMVSTREEFIEVYGNDRPLGQFIRRIVGLEKKAVEEAFSQYISNPAYSADQITFINLILDYLARNGYMEKGILMEQPFKDIHDKGLYGVFNPEQADNIIHIIDTINSNALYPIAV